MNHSPNPKDIQAIVSVLLSPDMVRHIQGEIRKRSSLLTAQMKAGHQLTYEESQNLMTLTFLGYLAWIGDGDAIAADLKKASHAEIKQLADWLGALRDLKGKIHFTPGGEA